VQPTEEEEVGERGISGIFLPLRRVAIYVSVRFGARIELKSSFERKQYWLRFAEIEIFLRHKCVFASNLSSDLRENISQPPAALSCPIYCLLYSNDRLILPNLPHGPFGPDRVKWHVSSKLGSAKVFAF